MKEPGLKHTVEENQEAIALFSAGVTNFTKIQYASSIFSTQKLHCGSPTPA